MIVPAEVRDAAAWEAANAGQTGHTILTSFHANNARDAYRRLVSMCHLAKTGLSDELLLEMCVSAWPVMVFKKRLKDKTRKYIEIYEATGVQNGKLQGQMLYQFVISETERDDHGRIVKVHGSHQRVGTISPELFNRLRDNGAPELELYRLFPDVRPEVKEK
jgi:pilus assembly protein CpaF